MSYYLTLPGFPGEPRSGARRFDIGGIWELPQFDIEFDYVSGKWQHKCKHARTGAKEGEHVIPRVVIAWNEGGHCSTGVCLDCILDAAKTVNVRRTRKK